MVRRAAIRAPIPRGITNVLNIFAFPQRLPKANPPFSAPHAAHAIQRVSARPRLPTAGPSCHHSRVPLQISPGWPPRSHSLRSSSKSVAIWGTPVATSKWLQRPLRHRAGKAEGDDARRGVARGPPLLQGMQQGRRPDAATEMVAALAPIDAGTAKGSFVGSLRCRVIGAFAGVAEIGPMPADRNRQARGQRARPDKAEPSH